MKFQKHNICPFYFIEIPFNQMDLHVRTLEKQEFIDQLRRGLFEKNGGDKEPVLESK